MYGRKEIQESSPPQRVSLPEDFTTEIPEEGLVHLYKHHFTPELIQKYGIGYSEDSRIFSERKKEWYSTGPRLIFPCYVNLELVYFEGRSISQTNQNMKYITVGGKSQLFFSKTEKFRRPIVLVEDIMSAMRVGENIPAIALRGTKLSDVNLNFLVALTKYYILWLDHDGAGLRASTQIYTRMSWRNNSGHIRQVKTALDPKCYSDKQIKDILNEQVHTSL